MLDSYDEQIPIQGSDGWYAGRDKGKLREEGNSFAEKQADLLQAHCERLLFVGPKSEKADQLRYDFILAVRDRFEGKSIHGGDTSASAELTSAGDRGRSSGESVDFCGITIEVTMNQMNQIGFHLERKQDWKKGNCVACLDEKVLVGGCNVCKCCEDKSNRGIDLTKLRQESLKNKKQAELKFRSLFERPTTSDQLGGSKISKIESIRQKYGENVRVRHEIGLGSAAFVAYDLDTGEALGNV